MTSSLRFRRAALLGLPLAIAACDVVSFIQDPLPIFEQTWSVASQSTSISVKELLPPGVDTTLDGSAFQVTVNSFTPFSRRVGDDCAQCQTLNGTTAIKPNFVVATGSSTSLPTDVVSGALIGGQVNVQVTNNLSFDPIRVKTIAPASSNPSQQGRMVIVIRSGSLVVGKDSINGVTTAFPPGTVLTRPITLQTGNITSALAVDLTLSSPPSDNNVFINANGTLNATASVPDFRIASARVNVVNRTISSISGTSIPLADLDSSITKAVVSATLEMTITNPFNVTGNVDVQFDVPTQSVVKTVAFPTGIDQVRSVGLTTAEIQPLFGNDVDLSLSGSVNSVTPIDVTPNQVITVTNRLILVIHSGGGTICPKNFCVPVPGGD